MYFIVSQMDFDSSTVVGSEAPYIDDDGDEIEAKIVIFPFGRRSRLSSHRIVMDMDEADDLARQLLQVIADARNGRYVSRE